MELFFILVGIFVILLPIYIILSKANRKQQLKRCQAVLRTALDNELSSTIAKAESVVSPIRERLKQEADPRKKMIFEAFIENYPRIQLYNLFVARKSDFESRQDFNLDFVQKFYNDNNESIEEYSNFKKFDLLPLLDQHQDSLYEALSHAFYMLSLNDYVVSSNKIIKLKPSSFFYLKVGDIEIPTFKDIFDNTVLIYPSFGIVYKGGNDISIFNIQTDDLTQKPRAVIVEDEYTEFNTSIRIPYDAEILGYEWKYMTKKGEPDARYSYNPRYTRFKRWLISIHPYNVSFHTTSYKDAERLKVAIQDLVQDDMHKTMARICSETNEPTPAKKSTEELFRQYTKQDKIFRQILNFVVKLERITASELQRSFSIGYIRAGKYIDQMEELGFISGASITPRIVYITEEELESLISESTKTTTQKHKVEDKHPTKPWVWTEYAPGKFDWRKDRATEDTPSQPKIAVSYNASKDLDNLIGMYGVKEEINKLQNFIQIQLLRRNQGLKTSPISYHCVFTGNPGTGKTTVARIIAGIYKNFGILSNGHLVETDRSGLVAEYVGQTAVKTNKIIDSALDGVLFIDEAYSLVQGSSNDFGQEAISTLLKRIEDDRERLVVILAGYGNEMKAFIDSNPGLQSRFNRYIHFDDYSADELYEIFLLNVNKNQYTLDSDAAEILRTKIEAIITPKDKNFGNARTIRNLFEKVLEHQASRLTSEGALDKISLQRITSEDISKI